MEELQAFRIHYPQLLASLSDNFFPIFTALLSIILIGYLAGRTGALPTGRGKSVIAAFLFNIALPAGLVYNLYNVQLVGMEGGYLSDFMYGIVIVKSTIYLIVVGVGLALVRRTSLNWTAVFLFAHASVHSNDFGIGEPLLEILFQNTTQPWTEEFPRYMINSTMITYLTFVPITIFFLEVGRNRESSQGWGKSIGYALVRALLRPVVIALVVGIILRLIFGELQHNPTIPPGFEKWFWGTTLYKIRMSISPIYLIFTGLVLVGSGRQLTNLKQTMAVVAVSIFKLGVSPLMLKVTQNFIAESNDRNVSIMLYLYGTLPTSPVVIVLASLYELIPQSMALIVMFTTTSFAPIATLFLSLYYVSWCQLFSEETTETVNTITETLGYSSVAIAAWTLLVLLFLAKYRTVVYRIVIGQILCLIMYSSLTASIDIENMDKMDAKLTALGKAAAATTFSTLGASLLFIVGMQERQNKTAIDFMKTWKCIFIFICVGILAPVTLLSLTSLPKEVKKITKHNYVWDMSDNISDEFVITKIFIFLGGIVVSMLPRCTSYLHSAAGLSRRSTLERLRYQPIEETSEGSVGFRDYHRARMGRAAVQSEDPWAIPQDDVAKFQFVGFMSIITSMMSLLVEVWALAEHKIKTSKSFVGLVLFYQNMWLFVALALVVLFGTSVTEIRNQIMRIKDWMMECFVKEEDSEPLPSLESLPQQTLMTCHRFIKYHLSACLSAIGKSVEKTFGTVYEDVFSGEDLVTWLINVGLADDRDDAVEYGSKLVSGRVIAHIDKRRSFYDNEYLYRFTKVTLPGSPEPGGRGARYISTAMADDGSDEFQISLMAGNNIPDWY